MQQLYKFLSLTACDRILLCRAVFLLGAVRLGLGVLPFQRFRHLLAGVKGTRWLYPRPDCRITLDQIVWAVEVASYYMPGQVKCLARALTTQVLMNWYGYTSELRIGVAKGEAGQFEAHAWVEVQGRVVIGHLRDLPRYTPMPSFEGGGL